jgi:hypothetical protein
MKKEQLNRVVSAALAAASVGAVASVADDANAQVSFGSVSPVVSPINWGPVFGGGDWFAEFHQNGYVRELDMGTVNNWDGVFVGVRQP